MANFFTTPKDLVRWVKDANNSYWEASEKIMSAIGNRNEEQDIVETTKRIFNNNNIDVAAEVLFKILAKYNITKENFKKAEKNINWVIAGDALYKMKVINENEKEKIFKQAQIMRQPGEYPMPLRVCPKLPYSVGKRLISTYNCRHYCLDSITFDDDPERVYCGEALWRRHVMDKFSREWQDPKTGEWIGGYINKRFFVFPDAGTPSNPNVARDHGNRMSLRPWERTRIPRQHEWSIERRLQEQREPNSTKSITLADALRRSTHMIKLAYNEANNEIDNNDVVTKIFSESIDLYNSTMPLEDIALNLSEKYSQPLEKVVKIQTLALKKMASHQADVYKVIYNTHPDVGFYTLFDAPIKTSEGYLPPGTPLKPLTFIYKDKEKIQKGEFFDVYDAEHLTGKPIKRVYLDKDTIKLLQSWDDVQISAKETGLIEKDIQEEKKRHFPVSHLNISENNEDLMGKPSISSPPPPDFSKEEPLETTDAL